MVVPMHNPSRRYIKGSAGENIFTYVSYGSFTFPAAVSLKFNVEPVYDSSNRVPKWYKHTFTIETIIDPTTSPMGDSAGLYPVDLNMSQVRRWLSIPGQRLVFWNLGVGQNQRLNTSSYESHPTGAGGASEPANGSAATIKQDPTPDLSHSNNYSFVVDNNTDLDFGPKPRLLACECIGGSRVFRIVWTVECALPICCVGYTQQDGFVLCNSPSHFNGPYQEIFANLLQNDQKVTEFNYSLSWEIDEARFTTFNIVGSVEFSGLLVNIGDNISDSGVNQTLFSGAVLDSGKVIDALSVAFYLRPGFNRSIQWDVSRDKRRLEFRVTDKEIPSDQPYYPGIKTCNVQQTIQGSPLTVSWVLGFTAEYELQPGVAKFWAILAFVTLLQDRMRYLEVGQTRVKKNKQTDSNEKPWVLPVRFSFTDDIYSRKVSFDFSFKLICEFKQLFLMTRMYSNVQSDWLVHRQFLTLETLNLKGGANIRTLSHEPLVTACRMPDLFWNVTLPPNQQAPPWEKIPVQQQYSLFDPSCPPRDKSILYFNFTPSVKSSYENVDMCPVNYLSPVASTQYFGQSDEVTIPRDLSIDPNSTTQDFNNALLPGTKALIKNASNSQKQYLLSIVSDAYLGLSSNGTNLNITTDTPLVQRISSPVQYFEIVGGMASVCWEQGPPAVKRLKIYDYSGQEVWVNPVIDDESFKGPEILNRASPLPIFLYRFRYVFKIVGGYIANGILINLNGQDVEWDIGMRNLRAMYKELNGFKLGDFEKWSNEGIPTAPHSP